MRVYGLRHKPTGEMLLDWDETGYADFDDRREPEISHLKRHMEEIVQLITLESNPAGYPKADLEIVAFDLTEVQET